MSIHEDWSQPSSSGAFIDSVEVEPGEVDLTNIMTRKCNFSPRVRAPKKFEFEPMENYKVYPFENLVVEDHNVTQTANNVYHHINDLFTEQRHILDNEIDLLDKSSQRTEDSLERIENNLNRITELLKKKKGQK